MLPSGEVTFLMTDIVDSAASWEQDPQAMSVALARHGVIVDEVVGDHGGAVVRSRGDGDATVSVFRRPDDAIAAAVTLQRRVPTEPWPGDLTITVRMAVHSGEAELRDDDYFGPVVNRAARLRGAGHGGQILVSEATADRSTRLPEDVTLRDLGTHWFKGLAQPERIFMVRHPELPTSFPPLATAGRPDERQLITVVIAEDNLLVREGLLRLFDAVPEVDVVAACADLDSLLEAVDRHQPAVVVTDIRMPPTFTDEGIRAAAIIRERYPTAGVVVLSQYAEATFALELLADGSKGRAYLLKERVGDPATLCRAIREVAAGGSVVDPEVVEQLVAGRRRVSTPLDSLTRREQEVLGAMAEGRTNASIGDTLFLSQRAVEKHINAIFTKLGLSEETAVHRRVKAVLVFLAGQGG